jgi:hypothetical protein
MILGRFGPKRAKLHGYGKKYALQLSQIPQIPQILQFHGCAPVALKRGEAHTSCSLPPAGWRFPVSILPFPTAPVSLCDDYLSRGRYYIKKSEKDNVFIFVFANIKLDFLIFIIIVLKYGGIPSG